MKWNVSPLFTCTMISIFTVPFNSFVKIPALGELGGGVGALVFVLLVPFLMLDFIKGNKVVSVDFLKILLIFIFAFIFQLGLLYIDIGTVVFRGESGGKRFFKAFMVIFYFLIFTFFCYRMLLKNRMVFSKYVFVLTLVVATIGFVELLSWYVPFVREIYHFLSSNVLHVTNGRGEYIVGKLQSVTFEGSSYGLFLGMLIPWTILYLSLTRLEHTRFFSILLIFLLFLEAMLSGRTGQLVVFSCVLGYSLVFFLRRYKIYYTAMLVYFVTLTAPFVLIYLVPYFEGYFWEGATVSNASRMGTIRALIEIFKENPILGIGAGQYGFYADEFIPAWARNYEFKRWLEDSSASFFPIFGFFPRMLAEMGGGVFILFMTFNFIIYRKVVIGICLNAKEQSSLALIFVSLIMLNLLSWTFGSYKIYFYWLAISLWLYIQHGEARRGSNEVALRQ